VTTKMNVTNVHIDQQPNGYWKVSLHMSDGVQLHTWNPSSFHDRQEAEEWAEQLIERLEFTAFSDFKSSDTPRGPEKNSGHPATAGPPNNKEIA